MGVGALGAQGSLRDPLWAWLSTRSTIGAGLLGLQESRKPEHAIRRQGAAGREEDAPTPGS